MTINGNGIVHGSVSPEAGRSVSLVRVGDKNVLQAHWHWVKERLLKIKKRDKTCESWHPTHIKNLILEGLAGRNTVELFFAVDSDGIIQGFIVTTVSMDPYIQLPAAWRVWLGWGNADLIDRLLPDVEAIAREREYPAIDFISGRGGWTRPSKAIHLARHGFEIQRIQYRKEL